jgi:putative transposase
MASTFTSMNIHFVFSTKNREKLIVEKIRSRLWKYMGGIARQNKLVAHAIGGIDDHIHLLISIPASMSPSKAIQLMKGGSSKWVNEEFPDLGRFSWQQGYSAFSVSPSRMTKTIEYINNQHVHHKLISFKQEYIDFLIKTGIPYDEKYVLG